MVAIADQLLVVYHDVFVLELFSPPPLVAGQNAG
jgi:hypothetical protein